MSGYIRSFGPLTWEFDAPSDAALSDSIKNVLPNHPTISPGTFNGFFDNTATSGLHVIANGAGVKRTILAPIGIQAAPAIGDPCWCGQFLQTGYMAEGDEYIGATIPFGGWEATATTIAYPIPWGLLIHDNSAETGANSATGEGVDGGGQTTAGGFMVYQVTAGNGTATISIDDSADDSSYSSLMDTGELNCATVQHGIVALGTTDTVEQYLRWQLALNGATTVTFTLAFVRGR
jgi:hypothetical protein